MARSFSQEPRSDSHKIGETRYRMSHLPSTTAIARTLLLAGILLAVTVLASRSFFPAFAQEGEDDAIAYLEGREDAVTSFTAMDPDDGDMTEWGFLDVDGNPPMFDLDGDSNTNAEPIFTITEGDLEFVRPPDYESPWATRSADSTLEDLNTYTVIVELSDDATPPLTATTSVTIKVTNKDEDGTVRLSTLQPLEGIELEAILTDPDGRVGDNGEVDVPTNGDDIVTDLTDHATTTWKWARSQNGETGWIDIVATTTDNLEIDKNTRKPEAADVNYYLRATATYNDGHGEGKTAHLISAYPVLKNLENDHPEFRHSEGNEYTNGAGLIQESPGVTVDQAIPDTLRLVRRVAEDAGSGSDIGDPVEAYDDDGDVLTYEFKTDGAEADEDHDKFVIDRRTGQIEVGQGTDLDFDQDPRPTFTVTVLAADPSYPGDPDSRDSVKVTIIVTNVPESPVITDATPTEGLTAKDLNESVAVQPTDSPYTPIVSVYRATDEEDDVSAGDNRELEWTLSGNDMDVFELCLATSGEGNCISVPSNANEVQLRFNDANAPDHDNPADTGKNNVYNVMVDVEDSDGLTDSRAVAVTALNIDEPGSVTLSHPQPEVRTGITASLTDPDKVFNGRNVQNLSPSWQWYHDDGTAATSSGARSRTYTPHASDIDKRLFAVATYTDGEGSGKSATSSFSTRDVRAATPDDDEPAFTDDTITRTIPEDTEAGDPVQGPVTASDGDDFVYELKGTNASSFTLDQSGQISVGEGTVFDYETKSSYSVEVRALGPSGSNDIGKTTVTIMITNVEEEPEITGGDREISVDEGTAPTTVLETYTGTDDEDKKRNKSVVWSVHDTDTPNAPPSEVFSIGNTGSDRGKLRFKNQPDYESPFQPQNNDPLEEANTYTVYVRATDNGTTVNPNVTMSTTETVTVKVVNKDEDGTVTFSSLQPLQDIQLDPTLTDPDGRVPVNEVVTYPINDDLTDHATTTWKWERSRNRTSRWVEIVATTTDNPMIDTHMRTPEEADVGFFLRATASYTDGQGENKSQSGVTAEPVLKNLDNDTPVYRHADGNTYTDPNDAAVLASDAAQNADGDPIQVNDPIPDTLSLVREVDENSGAGTNVGLVVKAYDDDGDTLTYTLSTNPESRFSIHPATGQITVGSGTTLDHEMVDNATYYVGVKATDPSNASNTVNVTIKVSNVNDDPSVTEGAEEISLTEIISAGGQTTVITDPNEPDPASRTGTAEVENGMVELAEFGATDDDDKDPNNDGNTTDRKDLEWSLSGTDSEDFEVATTTASDCDSSDSIYCAKLFLKGSPNFEAPNDAGGDNEYSLTVNVTDSAGHTTSHDVTVEVKNVREDGEVSLSNRQPEVDIPITAELKDPDGGVTDESWAWDFGPNDNVECSLLNVGDWNVIRIAKSATYTPQVDDVGRCIRAVVTYSDSETPEDDPTTPNDDESMVTAAGPSVFRVQAEPTTNETPQFPDQDPNVPGKQAERTVEENTKPNSSDNPVPTNTAGNVGDPVVANDVDTTDHLTYTLGGDDADEFEIDWGTGQITVAEGTELDHETEDTYTVTVTATDSSLATDMISVTIEIKDVNEAPTIDMVEQLRVRGDSRHTFNENETGNVATYTATVPDGSTPSWSLTGADARFFSISGGVLSVDSPLDYEPHSDANSDNVYEVTVTAAAGGMSRNLDIEVTLVNVEETGTVSISPDQPPYRVGDVLSASLSDGDDETVTGWQWARSTTASGTFTPISGATSDTYTIDVADVDNFLQVTVTYDQPAPLPSGQQLSEETATAVAPASTEPETDGTVSFDSAQPIVDTELTASVSDSDGGRSAITWEWARDSSSTGSFTDVIAETSDSYTPVEADAGMYLRATATYTDDDGDNIARGTTSIVAIHSYDNVIVDGRINGEEVLNAVRDYFDDVITGQEVLEVVRLYFRNF